MTILVYDVKKTDGRELVRIIKDQRPGDDVHLFDKREEIIKFADSHLFQLVFVFYHEDPGETRETSNTLTHVIPNVNLVIAAKDYSFCPEAVRLHASGYILYPLDEKKVVYEFGNLLYPVMDELPVIRVFGEGPDIYINDRPVDFAYSRTAKLFEILLSLDGATISTASIGDRIWDDSKSAEKRRTYLQNLRFDLKKTLAVWGLEDAVKHRRGKMWLDTERFRLEYRRDMEI